MNGLIFGLGWNDRTASAPSPSFAPPDWVVGVVWAAVLFPLMAAARWQLGAVPGAPARRARALVTALLVAYLVWPLYTLALGSLAGALLGNVGILALALVTVVRLWPLRRGAAALTLPVALWVAFATVIVLAQVGRV